MFLIDDASAVGITLELFEHRNLVAKLRRRIWSLIRHGRLQIVLFGAGGTGKSTLGALLSGEDPLAAGKSKYHQSIVVERFQLQGDLYCTIVVPPGQERRADREWPEIFRGVDRNRYAVFVNVVCWGYHALPNLSYTETAIYQPGMSEAAFMSAYTENRRQQELRVFAEVVPHLMQAPGRLKMLTAVTKQDLWWDDRRAVEAYYEQGRYAASIKEIARHRGSERFMHEYVSASLLLANMATDRAETLAMTTAGYDEVIKHANLSNLVDTIIKLTTE